MEQNVRLRILLIMEYIIENADSSHGVTMSEIRVWLAANGIAGERKSIYEDIHALQQYGLEINYCMEEKMYYLKRRSIEMQDIRLLLKAIQAYIEISEDKRKSLSEQILRLASSGQRRELKK